MGRRLSTCCSMPTGEHRRCRRNAAVRTDRRARVQFVVAAGLAAIRAPARPMRVELIQTERLHISGSDLAGTIARHPISPPSSSEAGSSDLRAVGGGWTVRGVTMSVRRMRPLGGFFAKPRPFLPGDFVTTDTGTGLVHMAPDHGEDDFELCKAHGIDPVFAVEGDGKYRADWAWLGGQGSVINPKFNAPDGPICSDLREAGALLAASADYKHSYPHSWRSKAKVIFRCTPQWFVPMDKPIDRQASALAPSRGWETMRARAEQVRRRRRSREDRPAPPSPRPASSPKRAATASARWSRGGPTGCSAASAPGACRSRCSSTAGPASTWSIPRSTPGSSRRCARAASTPGPTPTRAGAARRSDYDAADYERVTDILDVWFDSGSHPRLRARKRALARPAVARRPLPRRLATSTAAGSSPRCSKAAPPAAARRTRRC